MLYSRAIIGAIFMALICTRYSLASENSALPYQRVDVLTDVVDKYVGNETKVKLFYDGYLSDQILGGLEIRDELTPYLMPDNNVLLSGSTSKELRNKVAVLFDISGNILAIGAIRQSCVSKCVDKVPLIIFSKTNNYFEGDFRRWANVRTHNYEVQRLPFGKLERK